ncbi:MAG TPA: TonB-dependent receptor [Tenuifilaceae bacterium]|nr:TonB-dependent receptor [Tenuifilaceae bacterium]
MRRIAIIMVVILQALNLQAQNGTFKAQVVDDGTGETLVGATISIDGTTTGTITDLDGFAYLKLTPGEYNIRISYISYQPMIIQGVAIESNQTKFLTVRLKSADLQLNAVVVTAKAVKKSENALLTIQKKSPKLFDAITSDQFSKIGVSDAAGALKKVTGVTISEGKYVFIRGLGDRYSKSTLNGSEIPSLDPNKNAVQLDMFPSNLIDNIIVYKTFSPDLPGDFAGGLVDISTKDFPESFNLQLSVGLEYNNQANFNNNFLVAKGSSTDILGFDNGFRDLPGEVGKYTSETFPDPYLDPSGITSVSRAFKNRQFQPTNAAQLLDHNINFSIGNAVTLFGKQLGYVFGLSYKRDFSNYTDGIQNVYEGISEGQTTLDKDVLSATTEQKSTDEVLIGSLFNSTYKINDMNKVSIGILGNQSGESVCRFQDGYKLDTNPDSTDRLQNRGIGYTERSFINGLVRGEHVISSLNKMTVNWSNSYTTSSIKQPDLRLLRNAYTIDDQGDSSFYIGNNEKPYRFFRDLKEKNDNAKIDFTLPVDFWGTKSKIKLGGAYTFKERKFREQAYYYSIHYNKNYNGDVLVLFTDENLGYNGTELRNFLITDFAAPNNYDATQHLLATYLMLESSVSNSISFTTGVRFEKTNMSLNAFDGTSGKIDANNFLPSLAFTYKIGEQMNVRVSANRTLARPSFREFAPLATYDFIGGYIQNGNPNLKSTTINNFDVRWEQFPNIGEYLSFSIFYKQFYNPIENAQIPVAGGSGSQFQYKNVDKSTLYGAELEVRKYLGSKDSWLHHLKAAANFSYIYAFVKVTADELQSIRSWNPNASDTRPMYDQAPYTINASLSYENTDKGWESSINFNMSGKRLIVYQIDLPSIYLQPTPDLNITVKKTFSKNYSIRFSAKNILNNAYAEEMKLGSNTYYTTKYRLGRSYSLSITYNFN